VVRRFQVSLIVALALFSFYAQAMTKLSATVDRNPVMERESFVLQIVADDSVDTSELDISTLGRSGLIVGRTSASSQTQIINGSVSKTTTWSVVLIAKNAGSYTIPALELNGHRSEPITVEVVKSSAQAGSDDRPIFLNNTIESNDIYLQQSVRLVTRLYFSPKVELQSGSLSEPELEGALIQQQGKDKETSEIIMGVRYRVIERVYTVTPQSSGTFVITSPSFNGEVSSGARRRLFSSFGQTKPVTAFGDDITLKVRPIPADYQGAWLASELVQLNEEWQPQADTFEVGEAITRTFTLVALNVNEEQLPEVSGQYPDSFKVYPDQSETASALRQNALVAQRINSEAIVANRPGTFELPEVSVSWFNTKTKRQQTATVPGRSITIVAPTGTNTVATLPQTSLPQADSSCPAVAPCTQVTEVPWYQTLWFSVSGWLIAIAILAWTILRPSDTATGSNDSKSSETSSFDIYDLKHACKNNDAKACRVHLLAWGQDTFGQANIVSLADIESKVSPQMQREIRRLNLSQYSKTPSQWQGQNLWHTVVNELKRKQNNKKEQALEPLN